MRGTTMHEVSESGVFEWPWAVESGLAIIVGAAGGGGGGGGALCLEGLNLFGATGGGGGGGGGATTLKASKKTYQAAGGSGGNGGGGGGLDNGKPIPGEHGNGCHFGVGGEGGLGADVSLGEERLVSIGGDGGKGFSGETIFVEFHELSKGDQFEIRIGQGGGGGNGGEGYKNGGDGSAGVDGFVLFVPLSVDGGSE